MLQIFEAEEASGSLGEITALSRPKIRINNEKRFKQANSVDCAVYVCKFIECFALKSPISIEGITENSIRQLRAEIAYSIISDKDYGWNGRLKTWASAEEAIQRTHGTVIGQQMVRLSWGRSPAGKQDQSGAWGQQVEPSQWAYYNYGYDPYGYAAAQDPYAYGAYAGYGQYPQQVEGVTDMTSMAGAVPTAEHREEPYDPLAIPDVDKLNASYLAVHGSALFGRPLWLKTSALSEKA